MRPLRILLTAGLAVTFLGTPASASQSPIAAARRLQAPLVPGANDWKCKPGKAHPRPVVLVHGTFGVPLGNWAYLSHELARRGYCVFALQYGQLNGSFFPGLDHIATSAGQLKVFVRGVLAATGSRRTDLVGHSQGGLMPRYYLRFLGGAKYVDDLVGIAPSNHGSPPDGTSSLCPACGEQDTGSDFLRRLNAGHEVEPGVDYTVITSRNDELVVPWQGQFLKGPARQVTNVLIQKACPDFVADHLTIVYNSVTLQWTLNALDRRGPADPRLRPACR
ncbi:MAG: alpha/beta fold hydrolase [Streptosporangiaceae bacterium]